MNEPESSGDEVVIEELQLVAYLDGELEPAERERIEQLLATDGDVRARLKQMESAWEALNALPRAEVSEDFSHSTVRMIAIDAADVLKTQALAIPSRARRLAIAATLAGAVAIAAGFWLGREFLPDPNQALLRDLPLLERLDQYQQAGSVEFLKELREERVFETGDAS